MMQIVDIIMHLIKSYLVSQKTMNVRNLKIKRVIKTNTINIKGNIEIKNDLNNKFDDEKALIS